MWPHWVVTARKFVGCAGPQMDDIWPVVAMITWLTCGLVLLEKVAGFLCRHSPSIKGLLRWEWGWVGVSAEPHPDLGNITGRWNGGIELCWSVTPVISCLVPADPTFIPSRLWLGVPGSPISWQLEGALVIDTFASGTSVLGPVWML